jgi:hypothetical protein
MPNIIFIVLFFNVIIWFFPSYSDKIKYFYRFYWVIELDIFKFYLVKQKHKFAQNIKFYIKQIIYNLKIKKSKQT